MHYLEDPNSPVKARAVEGPKQTPMLVVERTFVYSRFPDSTHSVVAANGEADINFSERITNAYTRELDQL
jgi:hypothetical protein